MLKRADVFLSYSKKDRDKVAMLAQALTSSGLSVWWDNHLDVSSVGYPRQIWEVLQSATKVLVVWSLSSIESDWVAGEAEEGRSSGRLVQVRFDGVRLRPPFNLLQTADLSGWKGQAFHPEWTKLMQALGRPATAVRPALPPMESLKTLEADANVGHAVAKALASAAEGEIAAARADLFAIRADESAGKATAGVLFHKDYLVPGLSFDSWLEPGGYNNPKYLCDTRYAGERRLGRFFGFCRIEYLSGRSAGDVFRGQLDAEDTTYSVRDFADNAGSLGWLKFRGEGNVSPSGPCEITMKNGAKFVGVTRDHRESAVGVLLDSAGVRWTGEFRDWVLSGRGVREDQHGRTLGEWHDGQCGMRF